MKTRTLSAYLGEPGNLQYASVSGGQGIPCDLYDPQWLVDNFEYYKSYPPSTRTLINSGLYLGEEMFNSGNRKPPLMNNCIHRKIGAVNVPFGIYYQYGNAYNWRPFYRFGFPSASIDENFTHLETMHSSASRRAWWHMQPRFEGEVSMLNFLFELKDFKDIMKHVLRPKVAYNKISKLLRFPPRSVNPDKTAAAGFLTWNLAIAPLLRDLASIHAQLCTLVREVQNKFAAQGSEEQSSHYSEVLGEESSLIRKTRSNYFWSEGTYQQTLFTATLHYNYKYKMRSTVDAFIKYWGLEFTAEVFWNAIPFSFILDYFLGIGKSLHAMEVDRNVQLHTNDYAESLLTRLSSGYIVTPDDRICTMVIDTPEAILDNRFHNKLLSGLEGTIYDRRITRPNYGPALPKFKLPSGKQGATMGALVRCML